MRGGLYHRKDEVVLPLSLSPFRMSEHAQRMKMAHLSVAVVPIRIRYKERREGGRKWYNNRI